MTRQSRVAAALLLSAAFTASATVSATLWGPSVHADSPSDAGGYVVVEGDSLSRIAAKLGVTLPALLEANGMTVSSLILPGQRLAVPEGGGVDAPAGAATYRVRPGDGLAGIAARHGVSLRALLDANGLTIDSVIIPDQRLVLPSGATQPSAAPASGAGAVSGGTSYTVRPGDSLSLIASRHGVSLGALLGSTGLTVDSLILPGQQLTLPAGASQPSAAPSTATDETGGRGVDAVLSFALAQQGKPYRFGAAGPDEFDCSGLVKRAYAQVGVKLPHQSALQARLGTPVDLTSDTVRPGDLIFLKTRGSQVINHVGIAVTATTYVHALRPGDVVRIGNIPTGSVAEVRRFL